MLIQITNRCYMGCAHCLQDSKPDGPDMTMETFRKALDFGDFLNVRVYLFSGGEPTCNDNFLEMCREFNDRQRASSSPSAFLIATNGQWITSSSGKKMMEKICKLPSLSGVQVYTNKDWYSAYKTICAHRVDFMKLPKVVFDNTSPIHMCDLGRARNSEKAQAQIDAEKSYFCMSCLNGILAFRQISSPSDHGLISFRPGLFCKPMVDVNGNVHISESWLCPSYGNVNTDDFNDIFMRLKEAMPCMGCRNSRKFLASDTLSVQRAKAVIFC